MCLCIWNSDTNFDQIGALICVGYLSVTISDILDCDRQSIFILRVDDYDHNNCQQHACDRLVVTLPCLCTVHAVLECIATLSLSLLNTFECTQIPDIRV